MRLWPEKPMFRQRHRAHGYGYTVNSLPGLALTLGFVAAFVGTINAGTAWARANTWQGWALLGLAMLELVAFATLCLREAERHRRGGR